MLALELIFMAAMTAAVISNFSIVAKHANASEQKRFEQVIRDVLQEQVKNGINKKTLLAAINGSEFKFREADFGRFPKGLMFGLQVMDSWLYDEMRRSFIWRNWVCMTT